jgi:hypothetical protein
MNFRFLPGLVFALAALSGAQAQSLHRCSTPSGSTYISEAPCAESSDQYATESGTSKEIPLVVDVEPLMKYLSPHCANLLDDLRNARERRLPNVSDLNRGYYRECNEEELKAANRLAAEQAEKDRKGKR